MIAAVLLAGIGDPKWPFDGGQPRVLSPFDESALEVALKLRDNDPGTSIHAFVVAGPEEEPLLRGVAAHRPDRLCRCTVPPDAVWDIRGLAAQLASALEAGPRPDVTLIGREFGDRDDGALPACLAAGLGWQYVRLAQGVQRDGAKWTAVRERSGFEERITASAPFVAGVTNDRSNRLRHPLFKNVLAAKRAAIESCEPREAPAGVALESLASAPEPTRSTRCRMLQGDAVAQAVELAEFLRPWIRA